MECLKKKEEIRGLIRTDPESLKKAYTDYYYNAQFEEKNKQIIDFFIG